MYDDVIEDMFAAPMSFDDALSLIGDEMASIASQGLPVEVTRVFVDWDGEVMAEFSNGTIVGTGQLEVKNVQPSTLLKKLPPHKKVKKPKKPKKPKKHDPSSSAGGSGNPGGSTVATDPYWNDVILLMPFSSDFLDVSPSVRTLAEGGIPVISTDFAPLGGGAVEYETNTDFRLTADNDAKIGTRDFTVEAWIRLRNFTWTSDIGSSHQAGTLGTPYWNFTVQTTGALRLQTRNAGGTQYFANTAAGAISLETWHHVAATRESGIIRVFVDGVVGSTTADDLAHDQSRPEIIVGAFLASTYVTRLGGNMHNFRFTMGQARYTTSFTAPTEVFPTS